LRVGFARDAPPSGAVGELRELYGRELLARGWQPDEAQERALETLEALRCRLIASHPSRAGVFGWLKRRRVPPWPLERGVYLWGEVGRGKTLLMDLFFRSLPFAERRRVHFHRLMHDVHAALHQLPRHRSPLELVAARIAREARVLCLDELAVSDIGDAMILAGFFAGLFREGVTLVTTSNLHPEQLYRDGLQRQRFLPAIALLEQHLSVQEVAGHTDYRLRELTQAGTYLASAAPDTQQRMEQLFAALAGRAAGIEGKPRGAGAGAIEILGRRIPVVRRAPGVVWFEFTALCAGPRSQEDYIEIAREYACVLLGNVPVLDTGRENEARRFVALIDELYDHHVNLVLSAAAAASELYRGERLREEFRRTSSRLNEMQTQQYLASEHRP